MFFIIDKSTQTGKCPFFILRLIPGFGTFDQDFFGHTGIGILPDIPQPDTGFHFIHILSSCSSRTESIPFDRPLVDFHFKSLGFRQYRHGSCRSMHPSLCLRSRNPLHPVHSRFIFHNAVHTFTGNAGHDFFVSSGSSFIGIGHLDFPPFTFTKFRIHPEQVAGKQTGFISSRSSPDLEYNILTIVRICGYQQQLQFLLHTRQFIFQLFDLHFSHFAKFFILFVQQNIFRFLDTKQGRLKLIGSSGDCLQLLILLGQPHIALHVLNHFRIGDQLSDLLKTDIISL